MAFFIHQILRRDCKTLSTTVFVVVAQNAPYFLNQACVCVRVYAPTNIYRIVDNENLIMFRGLARNSPKVRIQLHIGHNRSVLHQIYNFFFVVGWNVVNFTSICTQNSPRTPNVRLNGFSPRFGLFLLKLVANIPFGTTKSRWQSETVVVGFYSIVGWLLAVRSSTCFVCRSAYIYEYWMQLPYEKTTKKHNPYPSIIMINFIFRKYLWIWARCMWWESTIWILVSSHGFIFGQTIVPCIGYIPKLAESEKETKKSKEMCLICVIIVK